MSEDKSYGVAERFLSVQGEGLYTGTVMAFLRLAGCSVGKKYPNEQYVTSPLLPVWQEECTTWTGEKFSCDTDFRTKERLTARQIVDQIPKNITHVCITGGEPMNHNLTPLCDEILEQYDSQVQIHIETSGTVPMKKAFSTPWRNPNDNHYWITVSPKFGVLDEILCRANELKFLVSDQFDPEKVKPLVEIANGLGREDITDAIVWIQPINDTNNIKGENMLRCLAIQQIYPDWRISMQMHKIWRVR